MAGPAGEGRESGREGRRIEIRQVPEGEIGSLWREARKTNLFPSRALYREFFRELGGRAFTASRGPRGGLALMGRWRGGSDLHCLWFLSAEEVEARVLLRGALEGYLREGEALVTRMVDERGAGFFRESGFAPFKEIVLLEGDCSSIRPRRRPGAPSVRRFRREDLAGVLAVDSAAFDGFWRIDAWSLRCISRYCLFNRFVVAEEGGQLGGYCIAGTNGYSGYVQRLAVHPRFQRRGWGDAMLGEQLRWMSSKGTRVFLVNTQHENLAARELYSRAGFNRQAAPRYIYRYAR